MFFPILVSPLQLLGAALGIGPNLGRSNRNGNGQPEINININTENNNANANASSNINAPGSASPRRCCY